MPAIRYHHLTFRNGYAYRECTVPLDKQGIVLVRGVNADDGGFLGAGKSSPFEVFAQLQTGKGGKQRKGERHLADDIINQAVGEDFEAHLRLDVDGRPLEIVQYRKHRQYGNSFRIIDLDTGRNLLPHKNRKHPQTWLAREVLCVDEKTFFNLIYLAQDFNNVMLFGTDGERQQNLIQMFGLDIYDDLHRFTKAKLMALNTDAADLKKLRTELEEIEAQLKVEGETVDEVATELDLKRAELLALQQKHDAAVDKVDRLQERLRGVELRALYVQEIKKLWKRAKLPVENVRDVDVTLVKTLETQAAAATNKAADLRSALRTLEQREIIRERLLTLTGRPEAEVQIELDRTKDELRRLTNVDLPAAEQRAEILQDLARLAKPEESTAALQEKYDAARESQRELEREVASVKSQLDDEICPQCKRPFNLSVKEAKALKGRLGELRTRLKGATERTHGLSSALDEATRYEELRARLSGVKKVAKPQDLQREIGRLTRAERRLVGELESGRLRSTLEAKLGALPEGSESDLRGDLTTTEKTAQTLTEAVEVAKGIVSRLIKLAETPKGKVDEIKTRLRKLSRTIKKQAAKIIALGNDLSVLEQLHDRLTTLEQRRKKIRKALKQTKRIGVEIKCLTALESCFGAKGLKHDRFRAILNDATNLTVPHYAELLWPKRNAVIDLVDEGNAVRFELRRQKGLSVGSRLLSGGERNKAGLALLFGLRDLKERYTRLTTNLLIVDEPFGNMDPHGTDCLLRLLADLRDRVGTVVVIGNQRDVLTHDTWDQVWWAVREQHEACLYTSAPPSRYRRLAERFADHTE